MIAAARIETPEELIELLASNGGEAYFGEPVTVLEHCLQAAHFARAAGQPAELVVAALLHDVGHLLHSEGEDVAEQGKDTKHEELAQEILGEHLPPAVTEPIRMHVAAKRYLCFADPAYLHALSPSSKLSLSLQGGPMSKSEADRFLAQPFAKDAVTLRHWDDDAKIEGLEVPGPAAYLDELRSVWR
jgi:phosphonate degradation associated HDIG domain protein